jgi:P27 family predicted phage terminase small subunit
MGRRGPKSDPAAVKKAKGNPGRRPVGEDPIAAADVTLAAVGEKSATGGVVAPTWLKGEGLGIWDRLAPRLVAMKLLSPVDAEAFGRYCRNYGRWVRMQQVLDDEGEVYESESQHGKLKRAHPAFLISDRLERQLLAAEDRFGLNPAERQRLYAARAATPFPGDLFGAEAGAQRGGRSRGDQPLQQQAARGPSSPVGFLN